MRDPRLQTRNDPQDLQTRTVGQIAARGGAPASLDEETRSIEVVAATEQPVRVWDWERMEEVDEVLLMGGINPMPSQIPLLDTHNRFSTEVMIGSAREFAVESALLVARAYFSASAERQYTLASEGHLTDVSIGYRVNAYVWIDAGKTAEVRGKKYSGPIKVCTDWTPCELSVVPIGADEDAKVRARARKNKRQEDEMPKKLRAYLEARGLATDATEEQAWAFFDTMSAEDQARAQADDGSAAGDGDGDDPPAAANANPGQQGDDTRAAVDRAMVAERKRISAITNLCERHQVPHLTAELVREGATVEDAQRRVLDALHAGRDAGGIGHRGPVVSMGADETDKFRSAGVDALLVRGGITVAEPAAGHDELMGYSLRGLARQCLRRAGHTIPHDVREMVGRALSTSDLPYILGNTANRSLQDGFDTAEESYEAWVGEGSVNDFKTHTAVRASEAGDLDELPQGAEYKRDHRDEAVEQYSVVTYGKIFGIHRQSIINDDLGVITRVPAQHGESAKRKVGDVVNAVITANAAMGDGVALFHLDSHGNLMSGAAPSVASLGLATKAMRAQKDLRELRRLNIKPTFFLAPTALEATCEQFFISNYVGTEANPTTVNPFADGVKSTLPSLIRIYEPRLDDDDVNAWYLLGPKGKTVVLYWLGGVKKPYTETKEGWDVDGVEYKVRIDCGAKAMDWRGLVKNPGPS